MSKSTEQEDWMNDLGRRFADGEEDAFNQVVDEYSRRVYALCYRILRDEEDARDMTQEVFVRVYSKRRSFKRRSSVYTWIYRIALNMCLSQMKKRKAKMIPLEEVEPFLAAKENVGPDSGSDLRRLVAGALDKLPPKQRAVFSMRFYDKMSFKEIADVMGTTVGAAKANHHFALERLRTLLGGGAER
jgi:RNA polymerase sigma factor (sigma-70 family)